MREMEIYERKHRERYAVKPHHHRNYQILYVIEGEGFIQLEGTEHPLVQDSAAVIFPFADHAVYSNTQMTLLVLEFSETLFRDKAATFWAESAIRRSVVLRLNAMNAGELRLLLRRLLFEQKQNNPLHDLAMYVYCLQILMTLSRVQSSLHAGESDDSRAERMKRYIDTHYYESLTSSELSHRFGISSRHATALFKEAYQLTPAQYLTEVRLAAARKLLLESDKDMITIGFEVGYESLSTFYRVFKNHFRMSPNQFRRQYRD